jgi:hypothetical protein
VLSVGIVREVSRTAVPAPILGWQLTVDELIRRTSSADWRNCYQVIRAGAAKRVAREINHERPWVVLTPALPAAAALREITAAPSPDELDEALHEALREDHLVLLDDGEPVFEETDDANVEVLEGVLVE